MRFTIDIRFDKKIIVIGTPDADMDMHHIARALDTQLRKRLYNFSDLDVHMADTNTVTIDLTRMQDMYATDLMHQAQQDLEKFIQNIPVPDMTVIKTPATTQDTDLIMHALRDTQALHQRRANSQFMRAQNARYKTAINHFGKHIK